MVLPRAIHWAFITAACLCFTAVLGLFFWLYNWNWSVFAGLVGAQYGFAVGIVVLVKVPTKAQIAGIGAITGMGIDQIITSASHSEGTTAITGLAKVVANLIASTTSATQETGLPLPAQFPLSVGFWIFFVVVGVIMLFGSLEEASE